MQKSEKNSVIQVQHISHQSNPPPVYLRDGPNPSRVCTDKFCCLVFLLIMGAFGYIQLEAFTHGHDVQNISTPMDADGNLCGRGDYSEYPFIYFVTPDYRYLTRTVCVKQCPHDVIDPSKYQLQCHPNSLVKSCAYNPSPQDPSKSVLIYNTVPLGLSICEPIDENYDKIVNQAIVVGNIEGAISNIQLAFPIIMASAGITFCLALVFTCLLTYLTTMITWIFLLSYIAFTGLTGTVFYFEFMNKPFPYFQGQVHFQHEHRQPILIVITVIFWALCLRAIFTVLWRFTKIKFMITIIKLSTQFVIRNKSVILIPLVFFVLVMSSITLWLVSSIYILSQQRSHASQTSHTEPFQRLVPNLFVLGRLALNFLGLLWLRLYLLHLAHYLSASTSALWYMTANQNKTSGRSMLWQTLKAGLGYHNGSIVAGSLLLFFFEPMSNLFNSAYNHLIKYRHRTDNLFLHYFTLCFFCCCCFCEKCIMTINKQAYTEVYLMSTDFCEGSKAAHETMRRNNNDFQLLTGLGDSFTHFAKMYLFLTSAMGCVWYMINIAPYNQIIWKPLYPALLIGYVSLSTAELFMDMFGQSADSLLLSYFTDIEVEKFHYGLDQCASCPDEIEQYVINLRQKQKSYSN